MKQQRVIDKKTNEDAILALNIPKEGYESSPENIKILMQIHVDGNNN